MDDEEGLDRAAVSKLASDIMAVAKAHFLACPPTRNAVFEVLNALGVAAGCTIAAAGEQEADAREFFDHAVDVNTASMREQAAAINIQDGGASAH